MRWRKRVAIALLVGIPITVVVAWSCALWSDTTSFGLWPGGYQQILPPARVVGQAPKWWVVGAGAQCLPEDSWSWTERSGFGATAVSCDVPSGTRDGPHITAAMYRARTGWPALAMQSEEAWISTPPVPIPRPSAIFAWCSKAPLLAPIDPVMYDVPFCPMPLGFAIDIGFYAAMIILISAGPEAVRRQWRRFKGRCIFCAYDRSGLAIDAPCPECGKAPTGR